MNTLDLFRLDGKVALVTGAGSGLGLAFAEALADAGAAVACADLTLAQAGVGAAAVEARGRPALALAGDVSDEAAVRALVDDTVAHFGQLDIAVANAGIGGGGGALPEVTLADWQRVIDVDLTGVFLTLREAARVMIPRRTGTIIATASIYGLAGDPLFASYAYTAAKGGVVNLTRTAALQLAKDGIRVNAIAPAFFATNLGRGLLKSDDPAAQAVRRAVEKRTPLGQVGQPDQIKGLIVFLASDAASYVTGATVPIDGGWLAQ